MTFDLIRHYVDRCLIVSEEDILQAMRILYEHHQEVVEGAGALALAGLLAAPEHFAYKNVVCLVSGGNIQLSRWQELIGANKPSSENN